MFGFGTTHRKLDLVHWTFLAIVAEYRVFCLKNYTCKRLYLETVHV